MKVEINTKNLDRLAKAFKQMPKTRVGIMGDTDARGDGLSNATIGAIHEFGHGVPQRSFLRQPLIDGLNDAIEEGVDTVEVEEIIESGTLVPFFKKLGIIAETVVNNAFNTGGNGKWPKWITPGYKNNTGMLLVDTQQLQDSITSVVVNE